GSPSPCFAATGRSRHAARQRHRQRGAAPRRVVDLTPALLVGVGFVAAFIDSQVGGGGVISLPSLLALGLPPHLALGTNKLAGTGASFTASIQYARKGGVPWGAAAVLAPLSFLGAFVGVWAVLHAQADFVIVLVLIVMAAMTLYVLFRPRFGVTD